MRIHDVQILVASQNPHVHVAHGFAELGDNRNDVHGISAPVFVQHQQMPVSAERIDTRGDLDRDGDALVERYPQLVVFGQPSHELGESLALAVTRLCYHGDLGLTKHIDVNDSIFLIRRRYGPEPKLPIELFESALSGDLDGLSGRETFHTAQGFSHQGLPEPSPANPRRSNDTPDGGLSVADSRLEDARVGD